MNVVKDVFGRTYLLVGSHGRLENSNLKPMLFHEAMSAKRFLTGLDVAHGYWRRLLLSLSVSDPNVRKEQDDMDLASQFLVRGRVKAYEAFLPPLEKTPQTSRLIETGFGKQVVFLSAAESALAKSQAVKRFLSEKEAAEFLQSLNLTETNISAISATLSGKGMSGIKTLGSDIYHQENAIAQALVKGDIVIQERVKRGPAPKKLDTVDNAQDMPGNRAVDAPPPAEEKAVADKNAKQSRDAEQAEALIQAAEAGEAFCEDCEQVDDQ